MSADTGAPLRSLRVDGGAAANDLLMQIQSDLLGVSLERPTTLETTALGAVFLAGLGVGLWRDRSALRAAWRRDRQFTPDVNRPGLEALRANWKRAISIA